MFWSPEALERALHVYRLALPAELEPIRILVVPGPDQTENMGSLGRGELREFNPAKFASDVGTRESPGQPKTRQGSADIFDGFGVREKRRRENKGSPVELGRESPTTTAGALHRCLPTVGVFRLLTDLSG